MNNRAKENGTMRLKRMQADNARGISQPQNLKMPFRTNWRKQSDFAVRSPFLEDQAIEQSSERVLDLAWNGRF